MYTATHTVDTLRVGICLRFAVVSALPAIFIFCFQYSCNLYKNIYLTLFIYEAVFLLIRPPETT